mgnify:CR=1 FL=1
MTSDWQTVIGAVIQQMAREAQGVTFDDHDAERVARMIWLSRDALNSLEGAGRFIR